MAKSDINKELDDFDETVIDSSLSNEMDAFDNSAQVPTETMESKYLQPLYNVASPILKGLSIVEKPLSLSMGAGRSLGKLLSGQESPGAPIMEELSSPFPTPAGALTADLAEADIGTESITGRFLPGAVREEFPKASALVEGVSPNVLAEMVGSAGLGAGMSKTAGNVAEKMAVGDIPIAKKALIRGSEKDIKYVGDLQSSGKLDSLANVVVSDKNIRKNLNNPEKIVEYLQGIKREVTDKVTGQRTKKEVLPGKLTEIGNELGSKLKDLSRKTQHKGYLADDYVTEITNEIIDEMNIPGSGADFKPEAIRREISKYVKNADINEFGDPSTLDLEDIVNIKRGSAEKLYDMRKSIVPDTDKTSLSKVVADKLWKKADNDIFKLAESVDDFDVIKLNNQFSDYQKIRELYANKDIAAKYMPSLLEDIIPMAAMGGGTAAVTGSPYMGLLAAGGYPIARSTVSGMAGSSPARSLNMRVGKIEPLLEGVSKMPVAMSTMAIGAFKIPRVSEQIAQSNDMVIAKIRSAFGEQAAQAFVSAGSQDEVKGLLRTFSTARPDIFEPSKYNSIDGYIHDPMMKQKALNDIIKNPGSSIQDAKKMEKLIHDGYIGE